MPQADGGDGSVKPSAPVASGSKRVSYRGKHYDIPLWMSASTFEKRMRSGLPFAEVMRPPVSKAAAGRMGRRKSPFVSERQREIAVAMAKKALGEQVSVSARRDSGLQFGFAATVPKVSNLDDL